MSSTIVILHDIVTISVVMVVEWEYIAQGRQVHLSRSVRPHWKATIVVEHDHEQMIVILLLPGCHFLFFLLLLTESESIYH